MAAHSLVVISYAIVYGLARRMSAKIRKKNGKKETNMSCTCNFKCMEEFFFHGGRQFEARNKAMVYQAPCRLHVVCFAKFFFRFLFGSSLYREFSHVRLRNTSAPSRCFLRERFAYPFSTFYALCTMGYPSTKASCSFRNGQERLAPIGCVSHVCPCAYVRRVGF